MMIFFVSFIIFFLLGMRYLNKVVKNIDNCGVHTWRYDDAGQMYCLICKIKPGDNF